MGRRRRIAPCGAIFSGGGIMAKLREIYVCKSCQYQSPQWRGQCPNCRQWNTLEAMRTERKTPAPSSAVAKITPLREVDALDTHGFGTGCEALDRVLGHGLVPGAAILISGEPGIGKSTLLLQMAGAIAREGRQVLYASGEEALHQIKSRAERLSVLEPTLLAISTPRLEDLLPSLEQGGQPPSLLIVDSVQTIASESAEGLPGNVTQVRYVATELINRCKQCGTTLILVGHVTKDGAIAGPRLLEHLVDTVISLEGDRKENIRMLRVLKNRFGPNQELLIFRMEKQGLSLVEDPSTFFLGTHDPSLSGTSLVMTVDGQRPFAVEVQALAAKSWLSQPRRAALGFDVNRLYMLLAVMEKRLRVNFSQADIYAKVGGGIKLQEPGLDLPLVAAILSSFYDVPLPERSIFWGEVDLNGQIRPVPAHDIRLKQAQLLGYSPIVCQDTKLRGKISTLADLQRFILQSKNAAQAQGARR